MPFLVFWFLLEPLEIKIRELTVIDERDFQPYRKTSELSVLVQV